MDVDDLKNAAIRLRAITHNREIETTPAQQREWDDRIGIAEADFHHQCVLAGLIGPDDTFIEINVDYEGRHITGITEDLYLVIIKV